MSGGIRLDETTPRIRALIHDVLKASLSARGYDKALGCCITNHFLGELVNGLNVLNQHSYNFRLFLPADGSPSLQRPWGWTFFGHHLCLAVVFVGRRMVVGPTFMGAEPDRIDEGPHKGLRLFEKEEYDSLKIVRALPQELQERVLLCKGMDAKSGLGEDRWNPFDERHLAGARQDNRNVPLEGCPIKLFPQEIKDAIYDLIREFNIYLPDGPMEAKMRRVKQFENETYFAWIGGWGETDPYYFRISSPAVFCEFDFHCGSKSTHMT